MLNRFLETGGYGLPSLLYVGESEILIVRKRANDGEAKLPTGTAYAVYRWTGGGYKQYDAADRQTLWKTLESASGEGQYIPKQNSVIVKP
jgi:hypothetical protein